MEASVETFMEEVSMEASVEAFTTSTEIGPVHSTETSMEVASTLTMLASVVIAIGHHTPQARWRGAGPGGWESERT